MAKVKPTIITDAELAGEKPLNIDPPAPAPVPADPPAPAPVPADPPAPAPVPIPPVESVPTPTSTPLSVSTEEVNASDLLGGNDDLPPSNVVEMPDPTDAPEAGESTNETACPACNAKYPFRSYTVRHIKRKHADQAEELIAKLPPMVTGRPKGPRVKKVPDFTDVLTNPDAPVDYQFMSETLFDMTAGSMTMIFGPEWQPRNPDERNMMVASLSRYLKAKQMKDIPPGLMLTIVCVAYAAPRVRQPATSEKIKIGWTWLKMKVVPFFRRRRSAPVPVVMPAPVATPPQP